MQRVPGAAPAGTYTYTGNVGDFPGAVLASDGFPVVKLPPARGIVASSDPAGWDVSGWEDAATASVTATPGSAALSEAYPNPFASSSRFTLDLAEGQAVRVEAFDVLGRRVALLHDGPLAAGAHPLVFDASALPTGVYVVRATGEGLTAARRVARQN